ncbi:MAG: hypothetical protein RL748_3598 [Pseudomonadota bacterium]|jgi:hypothetical protein
MPPLRFCLLILFMLANLCRAANLPPNLSSNLAQNAQADLTACEFAAAQPESALPTITIGIAQPYAAPDVVHLASTLSSQNQHIAVCSESWRAVLPRLTPLAKHLERGMGWAVFLLAFLLTVYLLTRLTPRGPWRRTTLAGVLAVSAGTWLLACLILALISLLGGQRLLYGTVVSLRQGQDSVASWHDVDGARALQVLLASQIKPDRQTHVVASVPASVATSVPASASADHIASTGASSRGQPGPQGHYISFQRLNLRLQPGTESPLINTIERGQTLHFIGPVAGDWWRVRSAAGQTGWVSSLWLRRPEEMPH